MSVLRVVTAYVNTSRKRVRLDTSAPAEQRRRLAASIGARASPFRLLSRLTIARDLPAGSGDAYGREVRSHQLAIPPAAGGGALRPRREAVAIELRPYPARRVVREGVRAQEPEDPRVTLQ